MSRDRIDAWNAPQIAPAKPRPAEPLWTVTKDAQRIDAELVDQSEAGWELRDGGPFLSPKGAESRSDRRKRHAVPFPAQWFSRPPPSTTRPSLRVEIAPKFVGP
jgi:hypothetical protein